MLSNKRVAQIRNSNKKIRGEKQSTSSTSSFMKKTRLLSDMSTYDDEAFADDDNARNDFYQSDDNNNETGDEEEAASEINSENGAGGINVGAHDIDNELTTSDEEPNADFDSHKLKLKHGRHYNRPAFKDDWNSSEDTNERYCICKDVSYGDMICCDNTRVSLAIQCS